MPTTVSQADSRRAQILFNQQRQSGFRHTDRMFAWLMVLQWIAGVVVAYWISPRTWAGSQSQTHLHLWAAVFLGGGITSLPVYLALRQPGRTLTRHTIAVGQMLMSALLVHLSGGRIETHFHVFGSLAFLAFYLDWKVLVTASLVVVLDHLTRGLFFPQSVYGVLTPSPWRVLEHTGWVLFEVLFLMLSIRYRLQERQGLARRQAENERLLRESEEGALRQRRFLRDVLFSVSDRKLRLCDSAADLPAALPSASDTLSLTASSLCILRRQAQAVAQNHGFPQDRCQDLITAVGEAGMNAVVHAGGGEARGCVGHKGTLQVWVEDHGPGIAFSTLHQATLERGFTTAGSLGHGFWLMLRTADRIWLLTGPSGTTVVLELDRVPPEPHWLLEAA